MEEIFKTLMFQEMVYDNFEISNLGKLKNIKTNKILKVNLVNGYWGVCISLGSRIHKKTIIIHKAVAETFIPNPDNKPQVNHKDGNKQNNYVDNLEWVTASENLQHAYDTKLRISHKGEARPTSKLKWKDVIYIRKNYIPRDKKYGTRALGRQFNVDHSIISEVVNNIIWKEC